MKKENDGFLVEKCEKIVKGMKVDKVVTFFNEKNKKVEGEYFYFEGKCNYILSWGFNEDSLGQLRKSKSMKAKKPFFSFSKGWFNYD